MDRVAEITDQNEGITGVVKSFVPAKGYGFIAGADGQNYFVHIKDVANRQELAQGQCVAFDPIPTLKGLKAKNVVPGQQSIEVYFDPKDFIWSKGDVPKGYVVIYAEVEGWAEAKDADAAREKLIEIARGYGYNAALNVTWQTRTESSGNYYFTMHKYTAMFAVVKRVEHSNDPEVIDGSRQDMELLATWWESRNERAYAGPAQIPTVRSVLAKIAGWLK